MINMMIKAGTSLAGGTMAIKAGASRAGSNMMIKAGASRTGSNMTMMVGANVMRVLAVESRSDRNPVVAERRSDRGLSEGRPQHPVDPVDVEAGIAGESVFMVRFLSWRLQVL